jgi:hypothetical protein
MHPPAFIDAIVQVTEELLDPDDDCVKAIKEAQKQGTDGSARIMALVKALPTVDRDHVLANAQKRMKDDADTRNWLARRTGPPDNTPPDTTRH